VIAWCIDVTYREVLGRDAPEELLLGQVKGVDYIKKIFQVPFDLRPVGAERVDDFFDAMLDEAGLEADQVNGLNMLLRPHLPYLVSEAQGMNPRDVKRYVNNFTMAMKTADPNQGYDPNVILTLQTLATVPEWQYVYDALRGSREMFRLALKSYVDGEAGSLRGYDPHFAALPNQLFVYLSPGNPGNALTNEAEIDKYLELGAASVDSSIDLIPETLALAIAQIREVRRNLQDVPFLDDQPDQGAVSAIHQQFQEATGILLNFLTGTTVDRTRGPIDTLERALSINAGFPANWQTTVEEALEELLSGISYYVNVERRRVRLS